MASRPHRAHVREPAELLLALCEVGISEGGLQGILLLRQLQARFGGSPIATATATSASASVALSTSTGGFSVHVALRAAASVAAERGVPHLRISYVCLSHTRSLFSFFFFFFVRLVLPARLFYSTRSSEGCGGARGRGVSSSVWRVFLRMYLTPASSRSVPAASQRGPSFPTRRDHL